MDFVISLNDLASGAAEKVKGSFEKLGVSAENMGKSLGMSEEMMGELTAETGGLVLVAAAAAAALFGVASVAVAVTSKVLEANEQLDTMTTQLGALGNAADGSGAEIVGMLDDMSKRLPETKDQLAEWAKPLMAAGVHGEELKTTLEATAAASALLGESGVTALSALEKKIQAAAESGQALKIPVKGLGSLAATGVNVADVAGKMGISADELGARLKAGTVNATAFGDALHAALIEKGKPAVDQANNSLASMKAHLEQNIGDLFEFTEADGKARAANDNMKNSLRDALSVFDASTASGKSLHETIMAISTVTSDIAAKAIPMAKHAFQELEIAALKIYITAKPLIKELGTLWTSVDGGKNTTNALSKSFDLVVGSLEMTIKIATVFVGAANKIIATIKEIVQAAKDAANAVGNMGTSISNAVPGGGKGGGGVLGAVASKLPHFASGGTVGGPMGAPQLAVVHGGETVVPANGNAGGGGFHATFAPGAIQISGAGSSGEALELTEEALSTVLERVAMKRGVGRAG